MAVRCPAFFVNWTDGQLTTDDPRAQIELPVTKKRLKRSKNKKGCNLLVNWPAALVVVNIGCAASCCMDTEYNAIVLTDFDGLSPTL